MDRLSKSLFLACLLSSFIWAQVQQPAPTDTGPRDLAVTVGKSLLVDSPVNIQRVAVGNGDVAEAVVTSPREVLVNGKASGETSLIIWQQGGNRLIFDLTVLRSNVRLDSIRRELQNAVPGQDISVDLENDIPIVKGTATDLTSAERALALISTLGKPVNLLRIAVPPTDTQVLIQVKFANVDRAATQELGANFFSTGAGNTIGSVSTQQFTPPGTSAIRAGQETTFNLTDALNLFLFRPDLNLGATIKLLQSRRMLEILAEPNVLAINGRPATFLAGGEFPYPTLQGGGGGLGAVTIQFREFGIRINFIPVVTPRGTIRMQVTPEVSSLDFANGLVFQGFTIPALSTRRVATEVELEPGQSFAIGGLLDNRVTEALSKIPGLGDIPFFGKLFQSKSLIKNNTELLVMVTPEIVRPIQAGQPKPSVNFPVPFMDPNTPGGRDTLRTPPLSVTGQAPVRSIAPIPMEELIQSMRPVQTTGGQTAPQLQFVPMLVPPQTQQPSTQPAAPAPQTPAPQPTTPPAQAPTRP